MCEGKGGRFLRTMPPSPRFRQRRAALATALLLSVAPALAAQDTTASRRDTSAVTMPEVMVTATRTPESGAAVPLATSRVGREELRRVRGLGLDEALAFVPGVLAQSRAGGTDIRLVIRGFGARGAGDRSNAGTARGVRVLLDGIPETEPDGRTTFDLVDLAAVEGMDVVRSNASALWGNAAGGVVNITTTPAYPSATAELQVQAGGFGLQRYVARGGGPVAEGTLYGTVVRTVLDGWRQNSALDRTLVSAGYRGQVGGGTRLTVSAVGARNRYGIPGPLTRQAYDADPSQANAVYLARRERRDNTLGRLGASVVRTMGAGELSVTAFAGPKSLVRSERGTYREFDRVHVGGSAVYRHNLRAGGERPLVLVGGIDEAWQDGPARFWSLSPTGDQGSELRTDKEEGANNLGGFLQAEWAPSARWRILGGARFDAIHYRYRDALLPALDDAATWTQLTPKLGVSWLPGDRTTLFANVGGGLEAPAFNEVDPAATFGQDTVTGLNPIIEPMRSTTAEAGLRHRQPLGTRVVVALDAAAYWTAVRNELVPYRGGRFYLNAGRARRRGLELGATLGGPAGLSLRGQVTLNDHVYTEYVVDSVHYGNPGRVADYAGNDVVGVPRTMGAAELAWAPPAVRHLRLALTLQGNSAYFADDANAITVPGFTVVNASVGTAAPVRIGPLRASGFVTVNNLADRTYPASAFLNPDVVAGQPVFLEPGLPRHAIVAVTLGW